MNQIILKDGRQFNTGQSVVANVKFAPASVKEMKALGDVPLGYVAGWASTPDIDLYFHKVATGAFDESIKSRGLAGPKSIKLLLNHERDKMSGVIKVLETRNQRLWIEAQLNLDISYVKDAYEASKMIGGTNFSVGFSLQDFEIIDGPGGFEFLLIKKGDLFEVSVVPFPGNEECTMDFIKNDPKCATVSEFEKKMVALGIVPSRNAANRLTQEVKANLSVFQKEPAVVPETKPAPETTAPVLAPEQLNAMSDLLKKMRQILTPAQ